MSSTVVTGDVIAPAMTRREAQECVAEIKRNVETAWARMLELHDRQGWAILGYKTFKECMSAEFDVKERHAYHLINAARVNEALVAGGAQPVRERHARALIPFKDKPEVMLRVVSEVLEQTGGHPEAADFQAAVAFELPQPSSVPQDVAQPTAPPKPSGQPSPTSFINTLLRKFDSLNIVQVGATLQQAGRTSDEARALARWFERLADEIERY